MRLLQGGCLCGGIRYEAAATPIAVASCYCRDCQYLSGGSPAHALVVPRSGVVVTAGTPRAHWTVSNSGTRIARHFCRECGTPLFAEDAANPAFLSIALGSLDDPSGFRPRASVWVASAQPWHCIDPELPQWPHDPTSLA